MNTENQKPIEPLNEITSGDGSTGNSGYRTPDHSFASRVFFLSADPMCVIDASFRIRKVNPAFRKLIEEKRGRLRGTLLTSLMDRRDRREMFLHCARMLREGEAASFRNRLLHGSREVTVDWTAVPLSAEGTILLTGRDMTFMEQQQEQLRMSYSAMEAAANGIMITDSRATIVWVNGAFCRLSGYTREETAGKTPLLLRSGLQDEEFYADILRTISSGLIWSGELVNRRPDGSLYSVEETIAPIYDRRGEISHYVSVIQDITARKQTENILKEHAATLQREIALAALVQRSLLPASLPDLPGYALGAAYRPAQLISGDLYDCYTPSPTACIFSMADISGKGIQAAMLSASTKMFLRLASEKAQSPSERLRGMNRSIFVDLANAGMFITVFTAELDIMNGAIRYASAGHTEGLVIRRADLSCERLAATGVPLGILPDFDYGEGSVSLSPGDALVVYSDGITESMNERDELFGQERLVQILINTASLQDPDALVSRIITEVDRFRGSAPLSDDISLLVLRSKERTLTFSLDADLKLMEPVVTMIGSATAGYGKTFAYHMELAASELITNIVRHAYRKIPGSLEGRLMLGEDEAVIEISDDGDPFDLGSITAIDRGTVTEGSYGISLLRKICDTIEYTPRRFGPEDPGKNRWRAVKRRWRRQQ